MDIQALARSTEFQLIALGIVAVALVAVAVWLAVRRRETPESLERKRLAALHADGRLGDALVTDVHEDELYFTYTMRGIQYTASQNVRLFRDRLPENLEVLVGSQGMKYSTKNPVDSMLICEEWSGLKASAPVVPFGSLTNGNFVRNAAQNPALGEGSVEQSAKRQAAS
jgi:hypothetical protein